MFRTSTGDMSSEIVPHRPKGSRIKGNIPIYIQACGNRSCSEYQRVYLYENELFENEKQVALFLEEGGVHQLFYVIKSDDKKDTDNQMKGIYMAMLLRGRTDVSFPRPIDEANVDVYSDIKLFLENMRQQWEKDGLPVPHIICSQLPNDTCFINVELATNTPGFPIKKDVNHKPVFPSAWVKVETKEKSEIMDAIPEWDESVKYVVYEKPRKK